MRRDTDPVLAGGGPAVSTVVNLPRPARARPAVAGTLAARLYAHLGADRHSLLPTLLILTGLAWLLPAVVDWAVVKAVFRPDSAACRAVVGEGACWGVIVEKARPILFGRYPHGEHWRAGVATAVLLGGLIASFGLRPRLPVLLPAWLGGLGGVLALLHGGWAGLPVVESALWGGLPLTLLLAIGTIAGALPLGVVLALGRRSRMPAIRTGCVYFIELLRAVPLVSVLLLAAFLLPVFLPPELQVEVLPRVMTGLVLFAAAYLAEVLRGGLQSIPSGHLEAASALGLNYWQTQRHVVLPQAIRATLPALMNSFISIIKETSLVTVVSLYELTGALNLALSGDLDWREFYLECYLFTAAVYWLICYTLSRYSRRRAAEVATTTGV